MQKKAIIIGAGPAGLTAAYELLTRIDILPIILEKSGEISAFPGQRTTKGTGWIWVRAGSFQNQIPAKSEA